MKNFNHGGSGSKESLQPFCNFTLLFACCCHCHRTGWQIDRNYLPAHRTLLSTSRVAAIQTKQQQTAMQNWKLPIWGRNMKSCPASESSISYYVLKWLWGRVSAECSVGMKRASPGMNKHLGTGPLEGSVYLLTVTDRVQVHSSVGISLRCGSKLGVCIIRRQ